MILTLAKSQRSSFTLKTGQAGHFLKNLTHRQSLVRVRIAGKRLLFFNGGLENSTKSFTSAVCILGGDDDE